MKGIHMSVAVKRRWRLILWVFVPIVVFLALLLSGSMGLTYRLALVIGDAMEWKSHYLAGLSSVNCGRVKIREDASSATQCALQAYAKTQPFRVIYDVQGIDSIVAGGIVRTPEGALLALSYDSCPWGCGFSLLQQRVQVTPCPQPYHLYVNPKGRINCFQPQLSYPRNLMSPNMEPY
jgi:hypothetical protein